MESDLSLIEIAGEDDSLLQQIPNDDISSLSTKRDNSATDFFICSPLQVSRSNPIEDVIGSSCSDSLNKDNLRANKAELPKLSVERQQMKRKKKGGYNLRKSLAWDRAFFTEEGILNSEELSLINGSFSKSSGESLSSIQEEDPLYDSSDLQALEDKLFKEVPKAASNKDKKAAPSSAARRKVLSAHDVNISGSKRSACPRPVASPSLKRPANLVTTKAAVKDSRVPKFSVTKPDPFVASRTLKSATAGDSKQNLTARPVDNQKKLGTRGSSNNTRIAPNNSKPVPAGKSLPTKTSLGQARRNVPKSDKCLRTNGPSPLTTEANNGLEGISKQSIPSPGFSSNAHDGGSRKTALPHSQNASSTGLNMQHIQLPTAKPSGLRMPSPSLAFFDQSKRNSHSSSLSESNIPNLRKHDFQNPVSKLRPPLPSVSVSKVVNDKAPMGNIKASGLSSGSSVISAVNPALHEIGKSGSQLTNMQDVEQKMQYDQNSFQAIRIRQQSHSIVGDVDKTFVGQEGQCITKSSSQIEDLKLQRNDKNILLQGETGPKLNKHDNGANVVDDNRDTERSESQNPCLTSHSSSAVEITNLSVKDDATKKLLAEDKPCNPLFKNPGMSSELSSENGNLSLTSYSEVHGDLSSREHFVNEPFEEQAEMRTCNIDLISNVDQMLQVNSSDDFSKKGGGPEDTSCSEPLGEKNNGGQILHATTDDFSLKCGGQEEPQNHSCTEVADITSKVQDCNGDESETSYASSHSTSIEKGKHGFKVEDKVGSTSNEEDSEMQSLGGRIEVESSNHNLRTLEDDQHIMIVGNVNEKSEHLEFPNCSVTRDHVFDDKVHIEDSPLVVNSIFHEESKRENLLHSDKPEGVDACESESKTSGALCEIPIFTLDRGCNGAKLVECQMLEDTPSVSVSRETAIFHEESKQGNILHSDKPEGVGACERESKSSGALCEIPVTLDYVSNGAELVECQMLEDTPSVSVSRETAFFYAESKQGNILNSDKPEGQGVGACESESKVSGALCEIPVATLDCGSNGAELVECQMLEDTPSVSVSKETAVFHEESKQGNILHSDKPEGVGALCEIPVVTLHCGSNGAELVECQMLEDTPSVSVSRETAFFHAESKQGNMLHSDKPEGQGVGACESESKVSGALCEIPVATLDCGSNGAELVECQMLEDTPSVSVSKETAVFHEESKQGNILHSDKPEGVGALCEIPVVTLDRGSNGAELVACQMLEDTPSVSVSREIAVFHEESKQGNILHSDKPEGQGVGACESESKGSGALSEIPVVTLDRGSNGAELVACQMLEDTPSVTVSKETAIFHEESKQGNILHSDKAEGVGALCEIPVVTLHCGSNGAELVECQMLEDAPSVSVSRETAVLHEESKQGNLLHSDKPEGQGVGACESESKGSGARCEIPVVTQDRGSNGAELVACQMLEDTPSVSVSKETAVFHEESKQGNILHSDKAEGVGALCEIPVVTLHCGSNGAELLECQMMEDTPSVSFSRETAVFHEESKQGNILHSDKPEGQGVGACESESKGSGALSEIPVVTLHCGSNGAELVECQMLEDTPSVSVSKETAVFHEESKQGNLLHSDKPEGVGACESESKSSGALCVIPVVTLDRGSNGTELVDCQMLEDTPLVSVNRETNVFHEESKQENILHSDKPEGVGACEIESESSGALCEIPVTLDRGSNGSELVVCQMVEDMPSVSVSRETAVKNYNLDTSVHYLLFEDSQSLKESRKFNNVTSANDNSKLAVCDGIGLESSCILPPHEHMVQEHKCDGVNHVIQEKDSLLEDSMVQSCHGSSVVDSSNSNNSAFAESNQHLVIDADDKVGSTSNKEDSEMQSLVCHVGVESSNDNLSTSEDDQRIMIVGIVNEKSEHLEFPNSVTRDHVSKDDELHIEDCLLVENSIFREEPKQENILHSDKPEGVGAESESKSSGALCVIPVATLESGSNEASLAECQMLEDTPSVPVKRKTAVENYNLDTVFQHGGSELEKSYFNNVNSANVTSKLGVCDGSGLESPHSVSPHEHMDQEHKESDGVDHVIKEKESLLGDSTVQSCHGISVVESINSNNSAFAESYQHLVVDSPKEQFGCSELQNPGNGTEEVSAENCSGLDLNEASQMDNNAESLEEGTASQTVLQQCDSSVREPRTSSECTDVASLVQDADLDVRELKKSGSGNKTDVVIKPPPNVAPFSDEWLAAIEAAGEEILTIKSGAVQNSPPDKSQPEPNPWSPVKKKTNQGIGPFDCTKCTNTNH